VGLEHYLCIYVHISLGKYLLKITGVLLKAPYLYTVQKHEAFDDGT